MVGSSAMGRPSLEAEPGAPDTACSSGRSGHTYAKASGLEWQTPLSASLPLWPRSLERMPAEDDLVAVGEFVSNHSTPGKLSTH